MPWTPKPGKRAFYPENRRPTKADGDKKTAAGNFLQRQQVRGWTHLEEDLKEALKIAVQIDGEKRVLIYVGAGQRTLRTLFIFAEVRGLNRGRVKIHTIGIAPTPENEQFLKRLAAENGGSYRRVN